MVWKCNRVFSCRIFKFVTCIDIVNRLLNVSELKNSGFIIDRDYGEIFDNCKEFLMEYRGSSIPTDMGQVEVKYELPIFFIGDIINKKSGLLNPVLNCSLLVKVRMLRALNTLMIFMINILL